LWQGKIRTIPDSSIRILSFVNTLANSFRTNEPKPGRNATDGFTITVLRRISWVEGRIFLVQNPSLVAEVEGVLNEKNALVLGV